MPLQAAKDAFDGTALLGTSSAGVGVVATFSQFYPIATGGMAFIIMSLTIIHIYRKIKVSRLDEEIKQQEIELNKHKLNRHDD